MDKIHITTPIQTLERLFRTFAYFEIPTLKCARVWVHSSAKFVRIISVRKCVMITIISVLLMAVRVFSPPPPPSPLTASQRILYGTALPRISPSTRRTYVSEAIPVLDLAAVLWNGGQPLLVFHEIPRLFRLFDALRVALEGRAREHQQRDEKAHDIRHFHHGSGQKEGGKKKPHTHTNTHTPRTTHRLLAVLFWGGGGCWGWIETTNWLAYRMLLLLLLAEGEGEREEGGGREEPIW